MMQTMETANTTTGAQVYVAQRNETKRTARLAKAAAALTTEKAAESPEERTARLAKAAAALTTKKAAESPEERTARLAKKAAARKVN